MNTATKTRNRPGAGRILLEFLGSMNLAITLLVAVAVASVIGTVLKQNEAYQNYIIKFGPFWFEVFDKLALYDVYSATWFLLILAVLVSSTSVCIYRNAPVMLKDIRNYRLNVQFASLRAFHHKAEWLSAYPAAAVEQFAASVANGHGYRLRSKQHEGHKLVSGMKGRWNRLGYLFTHAAIVIICIGGLVDGNVPLKLKESSGQIKVETRDIPASQVPRESWLPVQNPSFRGSVTIPEGGSAQLAFLRLRDGYLVQPLPFRVEVKDFRIEHYFSGQPKSFESDLLIHDEDLEQPLEKTIAVNYPLTYKGYAIYQASFSDGGSELTLNAHPLYSATAETEQFEGEVLTDLNVNTVVGPLTLEITDFRLFNINPVEGEDGETGFQNRGPNFTFKLRNAAGEAREYENYMSPIEFDGRLMFLSGMRSSPAEPFRYLHVPADSANSLELFLAFNRWIRDAERMGEIADLSARQSFASLNLENPQLLEEITGNMVRLVTLFAESGMPGVMDYVEETVPADKREVVLDAYVKVLQTMLGATYEKLLSDQGMNITEGLTDEQVRFYDDSVNAISAFPEYGSPFFLQLEGFNHIQATGLQIARAPGKNVVYLGCALLTIGVFLMFYVPHYRLWFWLDTEGDRTRLIMAGTGSRHQQDFQREFEKLQSAMNQQLGATTA